MSELEFLVQVPRIFDVAVHKEGAAPGFSVPLTPVVAWLDSNGCNSESTGRVFSYQPQETVHAGGGEAHTKDF